MRKLFFLCTLTTAILVGSEFPTVDDFKDIAQEFNVDINRPDLTDHLIAIWKRPDLTELWQVEDTYDTLMRQKLLKKLQKLHCFEEISPKYKQYESCLIMGCNAKTFVKRVSYLKKLMNQGIEFKTLYLLVGERPLDPILEKKECEKFSTETEMAIDYTKKILGSDDFIIISVPKEGNRCPSAKDTIGEWIETGPIPGRVLAISNQPFCTYMKRILINLCPSEFEIEVCGFAADKKIKSTTITDVFSRLVNQTKGP